MREAQEEAHRVSRVLYFYIRKGGAGKQLARRVGIVEKSGETLDHCLAHTHEERLAMSNHTLIQENNSASLSPAGQSNLPSTSSAS